MDQQTSPTPKNRKTIHYYMRLWHNNIGYFIAGLVVIYTLSGIVQTYRDTDLLKRDVLKEKKLDPNLDESALGKALQFRDFKVEKTEADTLYFKSGTYNKQTGLASYTTKELYPWINKLTELHKSNSKEPAHYFTTIFGALLLFMSISAFWMFKPGTRLFSKGVLMTVAGIVAAVILLLL